MKIVVASKNPVKVNAVLNSFLACFDSELEVVPVSVSSGVSDQPMTEDETLQGAINRAQHARQLVPGASFYAGIEGGVSLHNDRLFAFAWIVIANDDFESHARTATFELPPSIRELIVQGMELGDADDLVFKKQNSKQQNGAVGLLTQDRLTRESLYQQAALLALIPFLNRELYIEAAKEA
ncbi:inosine/xanthosine triphosphatase [Mangrovibacterium lignilyticum]|uniref:inosine/xanthosine triphosphatase n=1 Tax=Mangrovibacterium lignilyticum TaxID=2668052 RepID=UPI0013CF5EA1|nr:inosine/xanthosine triphosphatase [Mangrovibacterium lignilyticum]